MPIISCLYRNSIITRRNIQIPAPAVFQFTAEEQLYSHRFPLPHFSLIDSVTCLAHVSYSHGMASLFICAFIAVLFTQLMCHCCINRKGLYPVLNFGRKSNSPLGSELKLSSTLVGNMSTFLSLMQYHCIFTPGCHTVWFSLNYVLHTLWISVALKICENFYTFTNYFGHRIVGSLEYAMQVYDHKAIRYLKFYKGIILTIRRERIKCITLYNVFPVIKTSRVRTSSLWNHLCFEKGFL